MRVRSVARPADAAEAVRLGMRDSALYVSGGTALQLAWQDPWKEGDPQLDLVDVSAVREAADLMLASGARLRIGAACRLEALRTHPLLLAHAPILAEAAGQIGALGVRNLATLGGNIGWRFGDLIAPLLALEARAELAGGETPLLADLLAGTAPAQRLPLIVALLVPLPPPGSATLYEKVGLRAAFSPSRLALAICAGAEPGGLRVAATGAGLPARRLRQTEAVLAGLLPASATLSDAQRQAVGAACALDLPEDARRARLAANLVAGHAPALHGGPGAKP